MFTGLIRHRGALSGRSDNRIAVSCRTVRTGLAAGDSVAVNGVCLTAAGLTDDGFAADLLEATLRDTTLGLLPIGCTLNIETALRAGDPLGGHFVQGHVDGTTILLVRTPLAGECWRFVFNLPDWAHRRRLLAPKGSICVDGVSLTIQELTEEDFSVELIPATLCETNLGLLEPGMHVNLETDILVKTMGLLGSHDHKGPQS